MSAALTGGVIAFATNGSDVHDFRDEYRKMDSAFAALSNQVQISESAAVSDVIMENISYRNQHAKININTASQELLETLPNIGPARAELILEYREKHGGFSKLDDLIKVKSIGKKRFEQMKPYICIQ